MSYIFFIFSLIVLIFGVLLNTHMLWFIITIIGILYAKYAIDNCVASKHKFNVIKLSLHIIVMIVGFLCAINMILYQNTGKLFITNIDIIPSTNKDILLAICACIVPTIICICKSFMYDDLLITFFIAYIYFIIGSILWGIGYLIVSDPLSIIIAFALISSMVGGADMYAIFIFFF